MRISAVWALARNTNSRRRLAMMCLLIVVAGAAILVGPAGADPGESEVAPPPLPVVTPTPSNWEPKFPFPYDQMRNEVTETDISAEREMCQWFNAQYYELKRQIERLNNSLVRNNGRYEAAGVQEQADAVTANIDRSLTFLTPRVQSLTRSQDHAADIYFPLYQGESFYRLWEQLSNVSAGIKGRQPTWFTGPSFHRVMRYGSRINRSHVCR